MTGNESDIQGPSPKPRMGVINWRMCWMAYLINFMITFGLFSVMFTRYGAKESVFYFMILGVAMMVVSAGSLIAMLSIYVVKIFKYKFNMVYHLCPPNLEWSSVLMFIAGILMGVGIVIEHTGIANDINLHAWFTLVSLMILALVSTSIILMTAFLGIRYAARSIVSHQVVSSIG